MAQGVKTLRFLFFWVGWDAKRPTDRGDPWLKHFSIEKVLKFRQIPR